MKKNLFPLIAAFCLVGIFCVCTKPDVQTDDNTVVTPPSQDKEDQEEVQLPVPVLDAFSTSFGNKAVYDQELTLKGSNFNPDKKGNVIIFGDAACTDILEASETEIVVKIPRIRGKESVQLMVSTAGGTSNSLPLDFDLRRCDSVVVFAGAKVEELRAGVKWTSTITTWEGQPRSINVVSISKSEVKNLHLTYPSGKKMTSDQCREADALVGINGQYFDNSSGGTGLARDFLKIDGVIKTNGTDKRSETFAGGAFVFNDGEANIVKVAGNEGARNLTDENIMVCGPLLLINGSKYSQNLNTTHNTDEHPRTAIALTGEGNVLLVTIDGRFPGKAVGMPTPLMQDLFVILGAKSALNLDGGGSTTMYIKDKGVVNHTCDGSNWDNPQERAVNSIIYLK